MNQPDTGLCSGGFLGLSGHREPRPLAKEGRRRFTGSPRQMPSPRTQASAGPAGPTAPSTPGPCPLQQQSCAGTRPALREDAWSEARKKHVLQGAGGFSGERSWAPGLLNWLFPLSALRQAVCLLPSGSQPLRDPLWPPQAPLSQPPHSSCCHKAVLLTFVSLIPACLPDGSRPLGGQDGAHH